VSLVGMLMPHPMLSLLYIVLNSILKLSLIKILIFFNTGTTWVSEMVWLLKNNLNFKEAIETPFSMRAFWPE